MAVLNALRQDWHDLTSYERVEQIVGRILLAATTVIMLYTLALALIDLVHDLGLGMEFLESEVLQDAFGSFLTVLILLEFNHSIATSLRTRSGAIQVRVVVLIAILVLGRKLILLDLKSTSTGDARRARRTGTNARSALLAAGRRRAAARRLAAAQRERDLTPASAP